MTKQTKIWPSLYAALSVTLVLAAAAPAGAQYQPRPLNDPATGETYHIEGAANFWGPTADMFVSSEGLGQTPTLIDFKKDLGLQDQRFPNLRLVLRPSSGNKFFFQFTPIKYTQTGSTPRTIIFNGQRYPINVPVNSTLDWKAYRFGYEYDFVKTNRGYGGFILEAKYSDVRVELMTPTIDEFAHAQGPIPALGGVVRIYVVPNISVTAEVTGFKLPDKLIKDASAHYLDFDIYGTLNFTNNIGIQGGYRSLDVGYAIKTDTGTFTLRGPYIGVVARY
jgi:hypothetical protein